MYIPLPLELVVDSEKKFNNLPSEPARTIPDVFETALFTKGVDPDIIEGNLIGPERNIRERSRMLKQVSVEPVDFAMERAIGKNDSVYSNFAELIIESKRKVGRIEKRINDRPLGHATGFLIGPNLILTNWHVFQNAEDVGNSVIQFNYELDIHGKAKSFYTFRLSPAVFFHAKKELDYCIIAVEDTDLDGKIKLDQFGYFYLDSNLGKLGNENEEALNIIHHPGGDFQQLSIRENIFIKITPTSIWYETDTAKGSSGSPVLNDQWQVVALHHSGVPKRNDKGDYINKDGKPIMISPDGKIDTSQIVWIANEGIRISVILSDIFATKPNNPLLDKIKSPSSITQPEITAQQHPANYKNLQKVITNMENIQLPGNVNISFPSTLIERTGTINISINQTPMTGAAFATKPAALAQNDLDLFEIKKLEEAFDFSICKGYQSRFLGTNHIVPLPMPKSSIRKYIARVNNTDSFELKYFHYSVIFHTVRMMPLLSAINVDGDLNKRKDKTERVDVWLRDRRINFDVQLNDAYYKKSGFDKGHMSRREDANWGLTPEEAKRNADMTCMYTNACPQVKTLNRSKNKGIWGKLELAILERGATKEAAKTRKITVFNGPIFHEDDPVYKGIQVPMAFYKIVLWLSDNNELRATGFKLTQEHLVDDIDFEAIDIDQDIEFLEYQCSIAQLEKETKLDFSGIIEFDTFQKRDDGSELVLMDELALMNHLNEIG